MRQGWKSLSIGVAFAMCALAMLPLVAPRSGDAGAAGKASAETREAKAKNGQRQFTGVVTAIEKNTFTVERRGKKPQSRVFARHAEIKSEGEVAKDARVTVYYREQGGQAIAHRVIVKPENGSPKGGR